MSILDKASARALHDFYVREEERAKGITTSRVLLKVVYDSKGKISLEAEDEGQWGVMKRIQFFFSHDEYKLERITKFLLFKAASKPIAKELPALRILDQKIFKHNSKSIRDNINRDKSFEAIFTKPVELPVVGKSDTERQAPPQVVEKPVETAPKAPLKLGAGLTNSGNSCYMNSVLQALRASDAFKKYLIDPKRKQELHPIADEMLNIYCKIEAPDAKPLSHEEDAAYRSLVMESATAEKCGWHPRSETSQEDADEFLRTLFDLLGVPTFNFRYNMQYQFPVKIPALERSGGPATAIALSIGGNPAGVTIQDLLKKNQCKELFERDETLNSDGFLDSHSDKTVTKLLAMPAKQDIDTVQEHIFKTAPAFLPICLKRYSEGKKDTKEIKPSQTLEITLEKGRKAIYDLKAVVVHHGDSLSGGHYFTYVPKMIDGKRCWVEYNDSSVTPRSESEVIKDISESGYIHLYDRRK